ncbi:protein RGF1 INDUCIBLE TRANSCRIPTION FACTOR 1-like [Vicia villosa]|uniref:protein RGF1 INDUCIBLE TRANSCRIPTION FACTOR 1-like n=1 Tax=Vicia villosa TaxID=3911 RepID=UPI00273C5CCE|nr:protein RGF1 INDUCIBLE TRANSCRIPTION FACTOR 1-like [Vicia villosa]
MRFYLKTDSNQNMNTPKKSKVTTKEKMEKCNLPNKRKRDWVDALLIDNFGICKNHTEKLNEKNTFCVDCGMSLCKHGKESHSLHQKLQIYKYCYQDVVKFSDLVKVFDCSNIQTYMSNNFKIVHLKSKKQKQATKSKETKASTPKNIAGGICEECGKYLLDKRSRFCSVRCKISIDEVEVKKSPEAESSISMAEQYEYVERGYRFW